jgi:Zn-dependent M16 (insulinase) family peptidase
MINSIADSGHIFARTYAGSSLTPGMHNAELLNGMTQVNFMSRLAAQQDISDVVEKLKQIASAVLTQSSLRIAITSGEDAVESNTKALVNFIQGLPTKGKTISTPSVSLYEIYALKVLSIYFYRASLLLNTRKPSSHYLSKLTFQPRSFEVFLILILTELVCKYYHL